MVKTFQKLLIFTFSLTVFFVLSDESVFAGSCAEGECAAIGQGTDATGNYCYTGNGCPSYTCEEWGGNAYNLVNNNCFKWECKNVPFTASYTYKVPHTYSYTVYETKTYPKYCTVTYGCSSYCSSYGTKTSCGWKSKQKCVWGICWTTYSYSCSTSTYCTNTVKYGCSTYKYVCGSYSFTVPVTKTITYYTYQTVYYTSYKQQCSWVQDAKHIGGTYNTCQKCNGTEPPGNPGPTCTPTDWSGWSACSTTCGGGTQTRTSDCGTTQSQACNTQACVTTLNIEGVIWNATDKSCTANPSESDEIVKGSSAGNVSTDISVTMDGTTSGSWTPSTSGRSYRISDVTNGEHTISVNVPDPVGYPNFKYRLACVNDQQRNSVSVNAQSSPTTVHLGYKLTSVGWFHVFDGDVFGGCVDDNCAYSISLGVPATTAGSFEPSLIEGRGLVVGNSDLSVKNSTGGNAFTSEGNDYFAANVDGGTTYWPKSFDFNAPAGSNSISSCSSMFNGNLDAGKVYKASRACVQSGLDNLSGDYRINGNGVAVIYVSSDGTSLAFDSNFRSNNQNQRRIMFVTESAVEITSDVGEDAPTGTTRPHIEASIISKDDITFLAKATSGTDTTVIVEGPLATKEGAIVFNRDRGTSNTYPAEIIKYNPLYLTAFKDVAHTAVQVFDISWKLEN